MVATPAVTIPFVAQHVDDNGTFSSTPLLDQSVTDLLTELVALEQALRGLREHNRSLRS